jgi:chemotaxis signal transduction protein
VDLARRLGRLSRTPILERRIVVAGGVDPVGLIVDEVTGVSPAGPPAPDGGPASPLVRRAVRVGAELVMVLDESALWTGRGG